MDIEDIATVFASEFIKHTTFKCSLPCCEQMPSGSRIMYKDFIKMNYARRRKLVEEVLEKINNENS
jgi:hypothetical protein